MHKVTIKKGILIFSACLLFTGCASNTPDQIKNNDPYESFNRPVHKFNKNIDTFVAKPISDTYKVVTPEFFQSGVSNFFSNLQEVNVILNDILQAKFKQSFQDAGRLALNSTLGLGGLVDVATKAGLDKHTEDFGQTLAVWGVPAGSYLVVPFLGPATLREIPGYFVDTATNPSSYLTGFALPLAGMSMLNSRAKAEGSLQFVNEAALDPYVFVRESFLQWRSYQATDGKGSSDKIADELEADLLGDSEKTPPAKLVTPDNTNTGVSNQPLSYEEAKRKFNNASLKLDAIREK